MAALNWARSLLARARVGLTLEAGEFGLRAVARGAWRAQQGAYCREQGIREAHFNHAKGYLSDGGRYGFLAAWPELEGVKILDPDVRSLEFLQALPALRSLDLPFTGKLGRGIDLSSITRLERLNLAGRFPGLDSVFACRGLKRLGLGHYPGRLESAAFAALAGLEQLSLSAIILPELDALAGLPALQNLSIAGNRSLVSLDGLSGARRLRHLTLESCPQIGSLVALAGLEELRSLWLYDCGPLESLRPLAACLQLRELNILGNTRIADGDFTVLDHLPQLSTVCIAGR
ncbi:leucine-rich repeat domain-containing protein [Massilia sp. BJB1822]|uniref:leucine-rich repeat domain-containing protein n=1 Tax=Massilia sp. BJB1822 TaxID=2744470 RepID=UPI001593D2A3|nr:leucine-rich repeat domain-containing protein [Massilia sp. BJB1822]NVD99455.1 leucine-rich repeat domain-containing protein [Massilia sp. BJB1822]